jgi:ABC-2 type transport system permease protein
MKEKIISMPIYKREIISNRKSFFIWTIILVALNAMIFSVYPSFASQQAGGLQELIKSYPETFIKAFSLDVLDLTNILHYFGMEIYLFITLLGSIYAMILGSGIISKEEDERTVEFLLAKPVSRTKIITLKSLAVLSYVLLFNIILFIANYIMMEIFKTSEFDIRVFILISLGALLLHLTFAAIGLLISVFIIKARTVMSVSLGIVIGAYFLGLASSISDKLTGLKYVSPFKYVDAAYIIINTKIDYTYLVIMVLIIGFSVIGTYIFYLKKDIHN